LVNILEDKQKPQNLHHNSTQGLSDRHELSKGLVLRCSPAVL
jgi:hypothetical protein